VEGREECQVDYERSVVEETTEQGEVRGEKGSRR
jgi:hypothetical protein